MTVTEYDENLDKSGVEHYKKPSDLPLSEGVDGVEEYWKKQTADEPAVKDDEVNPEDVYVALDSCIALRKLGGESKEVARRHCLAMFKNPNIRQAFENDAAPEIIGRMVFEWDMLNDPRSQYVAMRRFKRREDHERELAVNRIKDEIRRTHKYNGKRVEWLIETDLDHAAEKLYNIDKGKAKRALRKEKQEANFTVGNLFGENRKKILMDSMQPQKPGSVGSLYGKTRTELTQDALEMEATPLDRCIKARMDAHGESYSVAYAKCKRQLDDDYYRHDSGR